MGYLAQVCKLKVLLKSKDKSLQWPRMHCVNDAYPFMPLRQGILTQREYCCQRPPVPLKYKKGIDSTKSSHQPPCKLFVLHLADIKQLKVASGKPFRGDP